MLFTTAKSITTVFINKFFFSSGVFTSSLHTRLNSFTLLLAMLTAGTFSFGQNLTENFNSRTVSQLENDCWTFYDMGISTSTTHLNSGGDAYHAHADVNDVLVLWGNSPSVTSPFLYFDGNTDITFKHRLEGTLILASGYLRLVLINENGVEEVIFTQNASISPTTITVNSNKVGNYRIKWGWDATGLYANLDAGVDDIVTTAPLVSPEYLVDTVCENDMNIVYEFGFPSNSATYYYDWNFTGVSGGDIITTLTANDRKIQVDWTTGPGDYQILAKEYTDAAHTNCTGRETYYDVHVDAIPDVVIAADTVCEGEDFTVDLELEGIGPWTMKYRINGGGVKTKVFNSALETISLPWGTTDLDITQLIDSGPCGNTNLPTFTGFYFYPASAANPIYHY